MERHHRSQPRTKCARAPGSPVQTRELPESRSQPRQFLSRDLSWLRSLPWSVDYLLRAQQGFFVARPAQSARQPLSDTRRCSILTPRKLSLRHSIVEPGRPAARGYADRESLKTSVASAGRRRSKQLRIVQGRRARPAAVHWVFPPRSRCLEGG